MLRSAPTAGEAHWCNRRHSMSVSSVSGHFRHPFALSVCRCASPPSALRPAGTRQFRAASARWPYSWVICIL